MATVARHRPPAIGLPYQRTRPPGTIMNQGQVAKSRRGFSDQYYDNIEVHPVLEQPRLIFYSAAQPIIRWGHNRNVRTMMTAGMRLLGRWAYVGIQVGQFRDRQKIAGPQSRPWTYSSPQFQSGPGVSRTVRLSGPTVGR